MRRCGFGKALAASLLSLVMLTGGTLARQPDILGIYFDPDGQTNVLYDVSPGSVVTAYLCLLHASEPSGVSAWECAISWTEGYTATGWNLSNGGLNILQPPEFAVGLAERLPWQDCILLMEFQVLVGSEGVCEFRLHPTSYPAIPGFMAYAAGYNPGHIIPCNWPTGGEEFPVATIYSTYVPPACSVEPEALDFGPVEVGVPAYGDLTIRNTGGDSLTGQVPLACADFAIVAGAGEYALAPGQAHTITVRFQPGTLGVHDCVLELGSPYCSEVLLAGEGVPSTHNFLGVFFDPEGQENEIDAVAWYPDSAYLCLLAPSESSGVAAWECALGWTEGLSAFGWTLAGDGLNIATPPEFTVGLGTPLPWQDVIVLMEFQLVTYAGGVYGLFLHPTSSPAIPGRMSYSAGDNPGSIIPLNWPSGFESDPVATLSSTVLPPACTVEPQVLDFGEVGLGFAQSRIFTIDNDGGAPLAGFIPPACEEFEVIDGAGEFELMPGEARAVTVRFAPIELGEYQCTLDLGEALCGEVFCTASAVLPEFDYIGVYFDENADTNEIDVIGWQPFTGYLCLLGASETSGIANWECALSWTAGLDIAGWNYAGGGFNLVETPEFWVHHAVPLPWQQTIVLMEFQVQTSAAGVYDFYLHPRSEPSLPGAMAYGPASQPDQPIPLQWASGGEAFPVATVHSAVLPAECSVEPSTLAFGEVEVGFLQELTFTIGNTGGVPLAGVIPPACDGFTISAGGGSFQLLPGQSRAVTVRFAPIATGAYQCSMNLGQDLCSEVLCTGTATPSVHNYLGIFFDPDGTANQLEASAWYPGTAYLCLLDASAAGGVGAWECALSWTEGLVPADWNPAHGGLNIATPPQFQVGLMTPLPWQPSIVLMEFQVVAYAEGTYELYLHPVDLPALPGLMAYAAGDDPGHIIPLNWASGDEGLPVAIVQATIAPAGCAVVPEVLDFGQVQVSLFEQRVFSISNTGGEPIAGLVPDICGDFAVVAGAGTYTLQPTESHEVTVRFAPAAIGPAECALDLGLELCGQVICTGTAIPSEQNVLGIFFDPAAEANMADATAWYSDPAYLCLLNATEPSGVSAWECALDWTEGLSAAGWAIAGSGLNIATPPEFAVGLGTPLPWQDVIVLLEFQVVTHAAGIYELFLHPTSNPALPGWMAYSAGNNPGHIIPMNWPSGYESDPVATLSSTALPPACIVQPEVMDFGDVEVGQENFRTLGVFNVGGEPLTLEVPAVCGVFETVAGAGNFTLIPGDSLTATVRFAPPAEGEFACALDFGLDHCADIQIQGAGVIIPPVCEICPAELDFGGVLVGDHQDLELVITNAGGGVLAGVVPAECGPFLVITGAGPFELSGGQSHTVGVRFTPPELGDYACTLPIEGSCQDVPCLGSGVPEIVSCLISPQTLIWCGIPPGSYEQRSFTIHNDGNTTISGYVTEDCAAFSIAFGAGAFVIEPGDQKQVGVVFAPPDAQVYTCTIATGVAQCGDVICQGLGTPRFTNDVVSVRFDPSGQSGVPGQYLPGEAITGYLCLSNPSLRSGILHWEGRLRVFGDASVLAWRPAGQHVNRLTPPEFCLDFSEPLPPQQTFVLLEFEVMITGGAPCEFYVESTAEAMIPQRASFVPAVDQRRVLPMAYAFGDHRYPVAVINRESVPVMVIAEPLRAELASAGVRLSWRYQEGVCDGFLVYRRQEGQAAPTRLTTGIISGSGGEAEYTDAAPDIPAGMALRYCYGMIRDGVEIARSNEVSISFVGAVPGAFTLHPNYPNPFNPETHIRFELPRPGHTRLVIFDLAGRKVRTLLDEPMPAGVHERSWNGRDDGGRLVPSGVYYCRLEAYGRTALQKMLLLK